eukprot:12390141-Heterocapsa_arctica.AAC.1
MKDYIVVDNERSWCANLSAWACHGEQRSRRRRGGAQPERRPPRGCDAERYILNKFMKVY